MQDIFLIVGEERREGGRGRKRERLGRKEREWEVGRETGKEGERLGRREGDREGGKEREDHCTFQVCTFSAYCQGNLRWDKLLSKGQHICAL